MLLKQLVRNKSGSQKTQSSSSKLLIDAVAIAIIGIAAILLNIRMIRDGLNGQVDLIWHVTWLQHFSKQLAEGILYPRWLAGTNYGYGSPTFVFYPPLVYYFGSFLKLGGLNIEQTVTSLFSGALFLSGLNFYIYGRSHWKIIPALSGSLAYMSMPYLAFMTYWVSSLSSMFAIAWIPLGWWLTEQTFKHAKWGLGLALFWTTLALTHMPTLMLCFIVWLPCVIILARQYVWRVLFILLRSTALGLGVASFYLLPAILEKKLVNINAMKEIGGGFQNMMIGSSGQPVIPLNLNYNFPHIFTHQLLMTFLLIAIAAIFCRRNTDIVKKSFGWLALAIALAFMMSSFSWPIWQLSETLQRVQNATRLLSISSFQGAALFAVVMSGAIRLKRLPKLFVSTIMVVMLLGNFSFAYKLSRMFPAIHNPGGANLEYLDYFKTSLYNPYSNQLKDVPEYRPLMSDGQASPDPVIGQPQLSVVGGKADIDTQIWKSYQRVFNVKTNVESVVRVNTYYYPSWRLYVNGNLHPIEVLSDGTIGVKLSPGSYSVNLSYKDTLSFFLGILLSILCLVGLAFFNLRISSNKLLFQKGIQA